MHALEQQLNVLRELNIIKLDFDLTVKISLMTFNSSYKISPSRS